MFIQVMNVLLSLGISYMNKGVFIVKYYIGLLLDKYSSAYVSKRECVNKVRCGDELAH